MRYAELKSKSFNFRLDHQKGRMRLWYPKWNLIFKNNKNIKNSQKYQILK